VVHFTLRDNAENLGERYVEDMEATEHTRPHWFRTYVLGVWGALEDAAYIIEPHHRVDDFRLEDSFERFEAADYGFAGAPWCLWAVDYDGNLVAVDMVYGRDLMPSELVPLIRQRRDLLWGHGNVCWMDPSVWHRTGTRNKLGAPASLIDEFVEGGLSMAKANNDPRAGMARIRELLRADPTRRFPMWHPRAGELGSPRMFFTPRVDALVTELESAPTQPLDKRDGGEIVDQEWEGRNGHAAAMCRYAVLTRPQPSVEPFSGVLDDPRAEALRQSYLAEQAEAEELRWDLEEGELYA
jgi:hypothetical protein